MRSGMAVSQFGTGSGNISWLFGTLLGPQGFLRYALKDLDV